MSLKHFFGAAAASAVIGLASIAQADGTIRIEDPYFLTAGAMAHTGAAFMTIVNTGDTDDRLIGVASDAAHRVELHTHKETGDGIMQMTKVEDGFAIPAGGEHTLARGGDHVMFMGLTGHPAQGDSVTVTLSFETAGEMTVQVPVDLERGADMGMGHGMDHKQEEGHAEPTSKTGEDG